MKYLELFKQGFDSTLEEKVKAENWPFVGHDLLSGEVVYTEIPEPTIPDNELWYTTTDDKVLDAVLNAGLGAYTNSPYATSNKMTNGKGVITFVGPLEGLSAQGGLSYDEQYPENSNYGYYSFFGGRVEYSYPEQNLIYVEESTLKTVTIPECVVGIHYNAFIGCIYLTDIYYNGTISEWESALLYKPEDVDYSIYPKNVIVHCTDGDVTL